MKDNNLITDIKWKANYSWSSPPCSTVVCSQQTVIMMQQINCVWLTLDDTAGLHTEYKH